MLDWALHRFNFESLGDKPIRTQMLGLQKLEMLLIKISRNFLGRHHLRVQLDPHPGHFPVLALLLHQDGPGEFAQLSDYCRPF